MAGEFDVQPLGTVAKVRSGFAFKSEDMGVVGLPVIKIKNVVPPSVDITGCERVPEKVIASIPRVERFELKEGDTLIAMTGATVGKVGRFPRTHERHFLNQRVGKVYLTEPDTADYRYIYYILSQDTYVRQMFGIADGSAQANISGSQIENLEVPLPPLAEQKRIAEILGSLDDKIELNRKMNETLEAMARALFQSWFVDFDPVRAKLDGRQPAGMDAETAALFPAHFEEGEYGKLPKGWRHTSVGEVCAINDWTLNKNDDLETLEYVEISEVNRGSIANIAVYARGREPSRARRRLRHGDTALSTVRPDRGSYFLALDPPENRVASTGFAVLTPVKTPWSFVHAAMTQPEVSDHLGQMANGGAYPAVRPEIVGAWKVAMPNKPKILEAFHCVCAPLFERAAANRIQSLTLATLRDTLLPKLLSGELRVGT